MGLLWGPRGTRFLMSEEPLLDLAAEAQLEIAVIPTLCTLNPKPQCTIGVWDSVYTVRVQGGGRTGRGGKLLTPKPGKGNLETDTARRARCGGGIGRGGTAHTPKP